VAGPAHHHLVEVDIEHDAADIEQQHVGGVGQDRRIHDSRLQNQESPGNCRERASAQSGLKPVRKLC
jgi:hypothetical protein